MNLSALIEKHKPEIIRRWAQKVVARLGLEDAARAQLINDLPLFLDEVAHGLNQAPEEWSASEGAAAHGRHRVEIGVDVGGLAEEIGMVAETVFELAGDHGIAIVPTEAVTMMRLVARGTAESARAYANMRDQQLFDETARNFSFIAHELRTPLQAARVAVYLLANDHGNAAMQIERLQRAHDQLAELVDNSLVEARLQGEPKLQRAPHRTVDLMHEAIANAKMLALRKQIALATGGDDVEIDVDRKIMVSALTNLLMNGVKFSPEGASVSLVARHAEDRVLFEVEDQCGGMPEDLPPRLFHAFVQAGQDRSGFGLGLMIVKQAIEAHGGAVRVVNRPPHGCCFVAELPFTVAAAGGTAS